MASSTGTERRHRCLSASGGCHQKNREQLTGNIIPICCRSCTGPTAQLTRKIYILAASAKEVKERRDNWMPKHQITKVFFLQEMVCGIRWHVFFHSCLFLLAGFLVPALLSLNFQCSSQIFSKCYDSTVKLGNTEITVTAIPTKSRKDIISLIIITASALFRTSTLICKFCWEVTSRNHRCPQYWECLVALWTLWLFWKDSVTPAAHLLSAISTMKDSFSPQPCFGCLNYQHLTLISKKRKGQSKAWLIRP